MTDLSILWMLDSKFYEHRRKPGKISGWQNFRQNAEGGCQTVNLRAPSVDLLLKMESLKSEEQFWSKSSSGHGHGGPPRFCAVKRMEFRLVLAEGSYGSPRFQAPEAQELTSSEEQSAWG